MILQHLVTEAYSIGMLRTTAVAAAEAKGWTKADLARMTGLSLSTIYNLAAGGQPSAKAITALMALFPDLPYERLFVLSESDKLQTFAVSENPAA